MARKKDPKDKEYELLTNLELKLLGIILNPKYNKKDIKFFKTKIVSDYIDRSHLYRHSVKQDQDELTNIIINSGRFDINDGELYIDIIGCLLWGREDRICKHLQNGYVPSMKNLEGIIEMYNELSEEEHDQELFNYFLQLYSKMMGLEL